MLEGAPSRYFAFLKKRLCVPCAGITTYEKNVVQHNHILVHAAVWAPRRRPSYAQHNNYILNVGTYLGASAIGGALHRCPVLKGSRVVGVFYGQPPMPNIIITPKM